MRPFCLRLDPSKGVGHWNESLSPSNGMLSNESDKYIIYITSFAPDQIIVSGQFIQTVIYCYVPEQVLNESVE